MFIDQANDKAVVSGHPVEHSQTLLMELIFHPQMTPVSISALESPVVYQCIVRLGS